MGIGDRASQVRHNSQVQDRIDNHAKVMESHAKQLTSLRQSMDDQRTFQIKLAAEQRDYVDRGDKTNDVRLDRFVRMSFTDRWKWMFFGSV